MVRPEHLGIQIGLDATEGLSREHRQSDGYQGAGRRIEQPVRRCDAGETVADVAAGTAQSHDLESLRPLARPLVFGAVEACRAEPVLPSQGCALAYSAPSLLRGVAQ